MTWPTSIPPDQRHVTSPVREFWAPSGETISAKLRDLSEKDIRDLLRAGPVHFVVAAGSAPHWVPLDERFDFWKTEVRPRLVPPEPDTWYREDYPGEYAYCASEWEPLAGVPVVLLVQHD